MANRSSTRTPEWDHNPSSWKARVPICVLAGIAFLICAYLSLYQFGLISKVWDPVFGSGTQQVIDSSVAARSQRWFHMPDALLGAVAYLGDIIFGLAGSTRRWHTRPWLVLLFGMNVIPVGLVSAFLVFLQGSVVGAWCFLCLVTATISLILVALSLHEVWSSLLFLHRLRRSGGSVRDVFFTFWGRASVRAWEAAKSW